MTEPNNDPWAAYDPQPLPAATTAIPADPWAAYNPQPTARITVPVHVPGAPPPDKYREAAIADRQAAIDAGRPLPGEGLADRVGQGATLGWLDEIQRPFLTPFEMFRHGGVSYPEAWQYLKASQDLANEQARKNGGMAGTAAEIAGGLVTGAGALGQGTRLISPAWNYVANIGKGAGIGSILGAGEAPNIADIPQGMLIGGTGGALFGAAAQPLASGVGAVVRPLVQWARPTRNIVDEYLTTVMNHAGVTPQQIKQRVADANAAGQPYTVADALGYEGGRSMAAMGKQPGAQRQLITDAILDRQANMPQRVGGEVGQALGAPTTATAATNALNASALADAAPLYRQAEGVPMWSPRLQEFIDYPLVRTGLRHGVDLQSREALATGRPFDPYDMNITGTDAAGNPIITGTPNTRTMQAAKIGLDKMEANAREYGTGRATAESRSIGLVRDAMLEEMNRLNPTYAVANRAYGGPLRVRDAVETGREMAQQGRFQDTVPAFQAMPPVEQSGARIGYADLVRGQLERTGNYPSILRGKSQKGVNELDALSTYQGPRQPGAPDPLRQFLTREEQMQATERAARGGSSTAENLTDIGAAPGGLPEALNLGHAIMSGNVPSMLRSGTQLIGRAARGDTERQRVAITQALLARDPDTVDQLAARLADYDLRRRGVNPFASRPPRYAPTP